MKKFRYNQENTVLYFRKRYKFLQHLKSKLGNFYSELLKTVLPNQVSLPTVSKPNTDMLRFGAQEMFIHKATNRGERE